MSNISRDVATIAATVIFAVVGIVLADAMWHAVFGHDWRRPDLDQWYGSLKRPHVSAGSSFQGCCGQTDCHPTDAEQRGNDWWARIGVRQQNGDWDLKEFVKVPRDTILENQANPTGESVICHSTTWTNGTNGQTLDANSVTIWCFVPPTET